jgi:nanoRNase/pAp phosphatase (c-di-AMP/oligoRNAs hydrolase)
MLASSKSFISIVYCIGNFKSIFFFRRFHQRLTRPRVEPPIEEALVATVDFAVLARQSAFQNIFRLEKAAVVDKAGRE